MFYLQKIQQICSLWFPSVKKNINRKDILISVGILIGICSIIMVFSCFTPLIVVEYTGFSLDHGNPVP